LALLYVDRTRYVTGLGHCLMNRYLGHHLYGTGITYVGSSIPLVTGSHTHDAIEHIAKFCQQVQQSAPETPWIDIYNEVTKKHVVRNSIEATIDKYNLQVDETDVKNLTEFPEDIEEQVMEQCSLVGGLVWVWVKKALPWVLEHYEIVAVEREFEYVIDCDCGLAGLGSVADHEFRGCNGIVLMTRPDLILRHKMSGHLIYVELKTGGDVKNRNYSQQFEDNIQFALGAAAAQKVLGEEIKELYVHALHKGQRDREYNVTTREYDGPRKQNSPFCYGFFKEGQPPLVPDELLPSYWNHDPVTGKRWGATENRGYKKVETWKIEWQDKPHEVPYYEHIVNMYEALDGDELSNHIKFIGPIGNQTFLTERLLVEMAYEERRWKERTDYLDALYEELGGDVTHPDYQEALSAVIPRSWECYKYGGWCDKIHICFQRPGWEDPLSTSKYSRRTPNHPIELNAQPFKELEDAKAEQKATGGPTESSSTEQG